MDFDFKLPPGWSYRLTPNGEAYEFWQQGDPTHTFSLTKMALEVYGDNPTQLVKIISIQMEMLENSRNARTAPMGRKEIAPAGTELCTTPQYCKWARDQNLRNNYQPPLLNEPCYCKRPDYKSSN